MIARTLALLVTLGLVLSCYSTARAFQTRDYLTPEEVVLVQDAQILDKRIDVFIKAAERRVFVLTGTNDPSTAKQQKKDSESWGPLPSGSRADLMGDLAGIFDAAISNIDDVSSRDENNPLTPKALRKLAAAATRIVELLKPLEAQAKNDAELSGFDQLTEHAESILQAANKLPPPAEKKGKTKTEKPKETN